MVDEYVPSARAQHAAHFLDGTLRVGDCAEHQGTHNGVERTIRECERLRVADLEIDLSADGCGALSSELEHGRAHIDAGESRARGIERDISPCADADLEDVALRLRTHPRPAIAEEETLDSIELTVVRRRHPLIDLPDAFRFAGV